MDRNIKKIYVMTAMHEALVFIGVIYPFLQSNAISITQYFILQGVFSLALLLLEIPSGYLSDCWGRKPTLIAGSIFSCFGILIFALSSSFWHFLIAELLMAFSYSFYSGTAEALLYDTLLENNEQIHYRYFSSNTLGISLITQAVVSLVGSFIAAWISLRATMWCTLPFMIGSLIVAITLVEPSRHKLQEKRHPQTLISISLKTFHKNISLRYIIIISTLISAMTYALVWFTQPYQELINFPLYLFGTIHTLALLVGVILSRAVPRLEKRVSDKHLMYVVVATVIGSYLITSSTLSLYGLGAIIIGRAAFPVLLPLTNDIINKMTTSDIRATVLSIRSFSEKLIFALASPIIGYLSDVYSLNHAILIIGCLGTLVAIFVLIKMNYLWKEIANSELKYT